MPVLKLVPETDDQLKTPTEPFDFEGDINPAELAENLLSTMFYHGGVGLSANQCGLNVRVFGMGYRDDPTNAFCLFNPKIVNLSDETVTDIEGCLSYPGLYIKIKRAKNCRVRYQDVEGNTDTVNFSGLSARVAQHEIEHLDGRSFLDNASRFHLDQAMRKRKTFLRRYKQEYNEKIGGLEWVKK